MVQQVFIIIDCVKTNNISCIFYLFIYSEAQMTNIEIPDFPHLVNYPGHLHRGRSSDEKKDQRRCVMCGESRLCSAVMYAKPREEFSRSKQKSKQLKSPAAEVPTEPVHIIPKQNKGLCTSCDVAVWIIKDMNIEIKWCKGCKNFRPWAGFGDKGLATKCLRCRERQREKYAAQKEEKYKKLLVPSTSSNGERNKPNKPTTTGSSGEIFSSPGNHGMSCLIAATTQVTGEK